jgi:hypothetical protein
MFCLHFLVCNIQKNKFKFQISNFKKKKKKWHGPVKKKIIIISNFDFQNSKIKKTKKKNKIWDLFFDSILMSRDRAKPSSH